MTVRVVLFSSIVLCFFFVSCLGLKSKSCGPHDFFWNRTSEFVQQAWKPNQSRGVQNLCDASSRVLPTTTNLWMSPVFWGFRFHLHWWSGIMCFAHAMNEWMMDLNNSLIRQAVSSVTVQTSSLDSSICESESSNRCDPMWLKFQFQKLMNHSLGCDIKDSHTRGSWIENWSIRNDCWCLRKDEEPCAHLFLMWKLHQHFDCLCTCLSFDSVLPYALS